MNNEYIKVWMNVNEWMNPCDMITTYKWHNIKSSKDVIYFDKNNGITCPNNQTILTLCIYIHKTFGKNKTFFISNAKQEISHGIEQINVIWNYTTSMK